MTFATNTPPLADTIEVSLFGTGNGEAIAVHLGKGQWMLVDSCTSVSNELPLSLAYLKSLGIDTSSQVKLVVATHWHDDHVRGLSTLVQHCPSAELVFSQALASDEFKYIFGLYIDEHFSFDSAKSGVKELGSCFKILNKRKNSRCYRPPIRTQSDNLIFRDPSNGYSVWALSPSAMAIDNAHKEGALIWKSLLDEAQGLIKPRPPRTGILSPNRNHNAVALWVSCGERKILLGADLEEHGDPLLGWQAVLKSNVFPDGKAGIFKIPHHGSPNGDHIPIWSDIVDSDNPFTCITAYSKGVTPRPSDADIQRICSHTNNLHYTTLPKKSSHNRYSQTVKRTIEGTTKYRRALTSAPGHVLLRWDDSGAMSVGHGGAANIIKL